VHFVCAHAPTGTAAQAKWDLFFSDLSTCSDKRCAGDVLVVAIDGNASIGIKSSGDWGEASACVGEHGQAHVHTSMLLCIAAGFVFTCCSAR
jgi:hypothetical protein